MRKRKGDERCQETRQEERRRNEGGGGGREGRGMGGEEEKGGKGGTEQRDRERDTIKTRSGPGMTMTYVTTSHSHHPAGR